MRHLRADYDAIQPWPVKRPHIAIGAITGEKHDCNQHDNTEFPCMPIIPDDEPVFLLRATDPVGGGTVRDWAARAQAAGADLHLCERVRAWADEMDEYRNKQDKVKLYPDAPDGMLR